MKDTENNNSRPNIDAELAALKEQVLALAGIVESLFAESIIALVDHDADAAHEAQLDDYKAHKVWLQADSLSVDLLSTGKLELREIYLICTMSHIALNLKRMADKGIKIAKLINQCPIESLPAGPCRDKLSSMTDNSQTMFSNSIEAFVNQDPSEANGLHPLYHEVRRLGKELHQGINEELTSGKNFPVEAGTSLVLIGGYIEDIAEFALDNGNCISRLCQQNGHNNSNKAGGEEE